VYRPLTQLTTVWSKCSCKSFDVLNYSSDISVLPNNIPNILLPPAFFTALFWLALLFWAFGIVSIYVSRVYVVTKYKTHIYAEIVTHITFPIGMSDIYLLKEVFGITDHSITG
jgi:hypothetical protein